MEVVLPENIQRQLDQAAAIEAELYGQPTAPVTGNTEDVPPAEPQAEQLPEPVPQAPVVQPVQADEAWEQKFNVLRGKYEAEVPRLHAQLRELNEQIAALVRQQAQAAPAPVAEVPTANNSADDDTFGADLMDAVRRTAKEQVAQATKDIDRKVGDAVKPVAEKLVQNDTERFWSTVDSAVPDFEAVNQDSRWFQYLDSRIPGTRMTRRDAANSAVAAHDSGALVEMVNDWKLTVPQAPAPQASVTPQAKDDLSRQVAPTTQRDSAPTVPTARLWTGADYEAALDPRNMSRMPKAEYEALVQEAEAALADGRVRW